MHASIRALDPLSAVDVEQLIALERAVQEEALGGSFPMSAEQRRASLEDTPYRRVRTWVALAEPMDGAEAIVGSASLYFALQENQDAASMSLEVHPAFRDQGIATALVEEAVMPAFRESGRSLLEAWADIPAEGEVDDAELPANRLATRMGISRRNVGVCRALDLPIDPAHLDALQAEADEHLGGYRIELWDDGVPAEHLLSYGRLLTQLDLDEPDEDIEHEAPVYDEERLRHAAERLERLGIERILAVAIAPDGTVAGNSEIHMRAGASLAFQENTLVMPDHRGHRLGLAMKIATHRVLAERAPRVRSLVTFNSHVNPWMIGINERLGYRVRQRELGLQGRPGEDERVVIAEEIVDAPAAEIFELIADPARQIAWDGNDNLAESAPGHRVRGAGESFLTTLTKGAVRENHVVRFIEGRSIAWQPSEQGGRPFGQLWRWDLEPLEDGRTRVTHTYDWTGLRDPRRLSRARGMTEDNLRASILRLKALAEAEAGTVADAASDAGSTSGGGFSPDGGSASDGGAV
ncbi:GNAT family N-acetyltransferase [Brachybacterium sp. DNPG3]